MKTLAVDFDGTLIREDESGDWAALPGAAEAMARLHRKGYRIVIHSCRIGLAIRAGTLEDEIERIRGALQRFGIGYDEIYLGDKLVADAYIDDRAVPFRGDWQAIDEDLDRYFLSKAR